MVEFTGLGKKLKNVSGEINPLGVHRKDVSLKLNVKDYSGNGQYVYLPFC